MTAISHEWITLPTELSDSVDAYVAQPVDGSARHAGLLVLQEIWGVNGHIRDVTDPFALLGYLAIALDIFHRQTPRFEAPYSDSSGGAMAGKLDPRGVIADL